MMQAAIKSHLGVAGYMRLVLTDSVTGRVDVDTGWFPNLITNGGMTLIGDETGGWIDQYMTQAVIGSDATTPTVNDTWVLNQLGPPGTYNGSTSDTVASPIRYNWTRNQFRWLAGVSTGTIREVGIYRTFGSTFFARALVNPVIVKTATQILDLFYEFRVYPDVTDKTGTIDLGSGIYSYTMRACEVDQTKLGAPPSGFWWPGNTVFGRSSLSVTYPATGSIGSVTGAPSGQVTYAGGGTWAVISQYDDTIIWNKVMQYSVGLPSWVISGGFKSVVLGFGICQWQIQFTPNVVKTALDNFSLVIRISWNRYGV